MRGKRAKSNDTINVDNNVSLGSPKYVANEGFFTSRTLHHTPSLKAMRIYNDLQINEVFENVDTSTIRSDNSSLDLRKYDESSITRDSLDSDHKSITNSGDYATVGTFSISGSEFNPDHNEMGSTIKLVSPKVQQSWQIWSPYITTTICSTCMAAGLGNFYRLSQTTMIRGGLPFLAVYLGMTIFLGLPLLFLELGIGQLTQEGIVKSWRVVPFFKGIGYVKLLMCCMLSIYYPLYIGMSSFYIIWILKGSLPFPECSSGVKITDSGYMTYGNNGLTCLKSTFLKNPLEDPFWYGIYVALLFVIWFIVTIILVWKTKGYMRSLLLLVIPVLAGYLFLFFKSVLLGDDHSGLLAFFNEANWSLLKGASIWYYAAIQVFFSTSIGFGTFVTNAGVIYNKVNPFWTAFAYIIINALFGIGSVVISHSLLNQSNINSTGKTDTVTELHLIASIYDFGISNKNEETKISTIVFYGVTFLSGFISMTTLIYTLLKSIIIHTKNRWKWWHVTILMNFTGFFLGCLGLLLPDFDIVHLLDHYIVGNLVMVATVIEILALISFYGIDRIKADFEFIVGHILSRLWLLLWWLIPLFLTAIFTWAMITLPLEGIYKEDPSWLYGIGWGVVLSATFLIFGVGYCVVKKQDGYTFKDKFKASVKPSNNWGPKDPISRLNWIQWSSKVQQGEKDFTLKRKRTRDYTRSVKKITKLQNQASSELSTVSFEGIYKQKNKPDLNFGNIYTEVPEQVSPNHKTTVPPVNERVIASPKKNRYDQNHLISALPNTLNSYSSSSVSRLRNPLSQTNQNIFLCEDFGSLRRGPYIISDNEIDHICFRKYSGNNEVSEL